MGLLRLQDSLMVALASFLMPDIGLSSVRQRARLALRNGCNKKCLLELVVALSTAMGKRMHTRRSWSVNRLRSELCDLVDESSVMSLEWMSGLSLASIKMLPLRTRLAVHRDVLTELERKRVEEVQAAHAVRIGSLDLIAIGARLGIAEHLCSLPSQLALPR